MTSNKNNKRSKPDVPSKCDQCPKQFEWPQGLKAHMIRKHDDQEYPITENSVIVAAAIVSEMVNQTVVQGELEYTLLEDDVHEYDNPTYVQETILVTNQQEVLPDIMWRSKTLGDLDLRGSKCHC